MYINWVTYRRFLLIIFLMFIPQILLIIKEIFVCNFHLKNRYKTDKEYAIAKKFNEIKYFCTEHLCWDSYCCYIWYKILLMLSVALTIFGAILLLFGAILYIPSENNDIKKYKNEQYEFYSSLENPTSEQCRRAEKLNESIKSNSESKFFKDFEFIPIDTETLWAKFCNNVQDKADLLKAAGGED